MKVNPEFDKSLNECLHAERLPFKQSNGEARAKVMSRMGEESSPSRIIPFWSRPVARWSIAAAIAVFAVATIWFSSQVRFENTTTKQVLVDLPDGSEVILRRGGQLEYNTMRWHFDRNVYLSGEAFFEVEKSKKTFSVKTPEGEVQVLGTSFTVKAGNEELDVQCKTGRVAVYVRSSNPVNLGAGEGLRASHSSTSLYTRLPENIAGWTQGQYRYENAPVREVWSDLEEAFGYDIVVNDFHGVTYTGGFGDGDDLSNVLDIICQPLDLAYTINSAEKNIRITKK